MSLVARNTAALIVAQVGVRLTSLTVVLLVGRLLGPEGLGTYAIAGAMAALAIVVADAGIDTVTIRAMAAGRAAAHYLGGLLPLRIGLGLLAVVVAWGGALLAGYPAQAVALTLALALAGALETIAASLRAALRAAETMTSDASLVLAGQLFRAGLIGLALLVSLGLEGLGIGVVLAAAGSLAVTAMLVTQRHGLPLPRADWRLWSATAVQTAPVTAWLFLTQVGARSDAILIGYWWPAAEAGRFHAASGVLAGLNLAVAMALAALYPALVRARTTGNRIRMQRLTVPVLGGGLALATTVALLAPLVVEPLLIMLLGDRFVGAGPPLLILRWALPALVLTGVAGVVVRSHGQDRPLAWLALVGAIISLVLNVALIPAQGAVGAAISTLTAEVAMAVLALRLLRQAAMPAARPVTLGILAGIAAGGAGLAVSSLLIAPWWASAMLAALTASSILAMAAVACLPIGPWLGWPLVLPHRQERQRGP